MRISHLEFSSWMAWTYSSMAIRWMVFCWWNCSVQPSGFVKSVTLMAWRKSHSWWEQKTDSAWPVSSSDSVLLTRSTFSCALSSALPSRVCYGCLWGQWAQYGAISFVVMRNESKIALCKCHAKCQMPSGQKFTMPFSVWHSSVRWGEATRRALLQEIQRTGRTNYTNTGSGMLEHRLQ
jgi:hypothetical protein